MISDELREAVNALCKEVEEMAGELKTSVVYADRKISKSWILLTDNVRNAMLKEERNVSHRS